MPGETHLVKTWPAGGAAWKAWIGFRIGTALVTAASEAMKAVVKPMIVNGAGKSDRDETPVLRARSVHFIHAG